MQTNGHEKAHKVTKKEGRTNLLLTQRRKGAKAMQEDATAMRARIPLDSLCAFAPWREMFLVAVIA